MIFDAWGNKVTTALTTKASRTVSNVKKTRTAHIKVISIYKDKGIGQSPVVVLQVDDNNVFNLCENDSVQLTFTLDVGNEDF